MKTTINLRIDSELKDQLEFLSLEMGMSVSTLVREIISENIGDYDLYESNTSVVESICVDLSEYDLVINGKIAKSNG